MKGRKLCESETIYNSTGIAQPGAVLSTKPRRKALDDIVATRPLPGTRQQEVTENL